MEPAIPFRIACLCPPSLTPTNCPSGKTIFHLGRAHSPPAATMCGQRCMPIVVLTATLLAQIAVARAARAWCEWQLPAQHRYHTMRPEQKRGLHSTVATLAMRLPLFYYARALTVSHGFYVRLPDGLAEWLAAGEHVRLLDALLACAAAVQLFSLAHAPPPPQHHRHTRRFVEQAPRWLVPAAMLLTFRRHTARATGIIDADMSRSVPALTLLSMPLMLPGAVAADAAVELARLVYRLGTHASGDGGGGSGGGRIGLWGWTNRSVRVLRVCRVANAGARVLQWVLAARAAWHYRGALANAFGGTHAAAVTVLAAAAWGCAEFCRDQRVLGRMRLKFGRRVEEATLPRLAAERAHAKACYVLDQRSSTQAARANPSTWDVAPCHWRRLLGRFVEPQTLLTGGVPANPPVEPVVEPRAQPRAVPNARPSADFDSDSEQDDEEEEDEEDNCERVGIPRYRPLDTLYDGPYGGEHEGPYEGLHGEPSDRTPPRFPSSPQPYVLSALPGLLEEGEGQGGAEDWRPVFSNDGDGVALNIQSSPGPRNEAFWRSTVTEVAESRHDAYTANTQDLQRLVMSTRVTGDASPP